MPTSGTQTITPNKPGITTYTLSCTGAQGIESVSATLTTQTTVNTNLTITVPSTLAGWQRTPLSLQQGDQFQITSVSGQWTVDVRNFPYVKLGGYPTEIDRQIFQGCKLVSSWPYAALVGRIGDTGEILRLDHDGVYTASQTGTLFLRIHDDDRCLVDNDGSLRIQVSKLPSQEPSNLIILVHGCCTDATGLNDWFDIRNLLTNNIRSQTSEVWQIVVWDWTAYTLGIDFVAAYNEASNQGQDLATAILKHNPPYKYIHLIGHSAGSRLIQRAATDLVKNYKNQQDKPFIHLTFLDAFTPTPPTPPADYQDSGENAYGSLEGYPTHYSDQYVDKGDLPSTDTCLSNAFNFDVTDWINADKTYPNLLVGGHFWPVNWYKQSITGSGFKFGYPLSYEGGVQTYISLFIDYPNHLQCSLTDVNTSCKPVSTDPTYRCW
jgi:hypothetical protein